MKVKFVLFIILFSFYGFAQEQNDSISIQIKNTFNTSIEYFNFPARFEESDWLKTGAVISGAVLASIFDKNIRNFSQDIDNRNSFLDHVMKIDNFYGTTEAALGVAGITWLSGMIFDSSPVKECAVLIGESVLCSSILTHILKRSFGRERPYLSESQYSFKGFHLSAIDRQSLPSGHTTCAFAISTVIAGYTDDNFIKALIYLPALTTAYARIYHNQHWFSDVLMGAGIGYFTGKFILNKKSIKDNISTSLLYDGNSLMLSFKIVL